MKYARNQAPIAIKCEVRGIAHVTIDGKHYMLGSISHLMFDGFGEKVFLNEVKAAMRVAK